MTAQAAPSPAAAPAALSPAQLNQLRERFAYAHPSFPGVALAVRTPRLTWAGSAGVADRATRTPLRTTAATWLRQQTGDARLVAAYLGHADLSTVSRYAHVADGELHDAAAAIAASSGLTAAWETPPALAYERAGRSEAGTARRRFVSEQQRARRRAPARS